MMCTIDEFVQYLKDEGVIGIKVTKIYNADRGESFDLPDVRWVPSYPPISHPIQKGYIEPRHIDFTCRGYIGEDHVEVVNID